MRLASKHIALALIPIIGASVLLCGQPYLRYRSTNTYNLKEISPMVFYYTNHEVFVGDSRYGPTNIVISNDYSGTIQIGSNFATAKELSVWMAILDSITRTPEAGTTNAWPTNLTYTVNVADGLWTHTNVIDIHTCSEFCTRMRYVENGLTNDFHAAFTGYTVITNSP